MPAATFEHDGETFPLIMSIDDLDIGDAEVLEDEVGIDLKAFSGLKLSQQLKLFVLMSIRRSRPDFTLDDCRRVKLGPIVAAINAQVPDAEPEPEPEPDDGAVLSPSSAGSDETPAPAAGARPARKASRRPAAGTARRSRTSSTSAPGKSTS